ncbi:MAG: GAF domain-containing protein [Chloroflexi bacterium]|nr:GAF domain-containing protein [Chloroflexota bacterium]
MSFLVDLRSNLFLRTVVLMAVVVVLVGTAAIYSTRFPIESRMREEAIRDATNHIQPLALSMLTPQQLSQPLSGPEYEAVDEIVKRHFLEFGISRVKFWNSHGVVTYSTLPAQIGEAPPGNSLLRALRGETVWELRKEVESAADAELGLAMEVYLPLSWTQGEPPTVVAEVYVPYAHYAGVVSAVQRGILVAVALAGLAVAGALYVAYATGWKGISRERDHARQRVREMEALAAVAGALTQHGTRAQRVQTILQQVREVSGADTALLRVPVGQDGALRLEAWAKSEEIYQDFTISPIVTGKDSLAGQAYLQGAPVVAQDYAAHANVSPNALSQGIRSGIALPIHSDGRVLGVISIASRLPRYFTAGRVRLLSAVADSLGALLEQARLHDALQEELEEEHKRQETLLSITRRLALEDEASHALWYIVDSTRALVDAQYGTLCIWDASGNAVTSIMSGMPAEERTRIGEIPHGLGLLGFVRDANSPIRLKDIGSHPKSVGFPPNHPPMTTLLGVPLHLRNGYHGAIYLTNKSGGREFTEEDERAVSLIGALAVSLVDNNTLYQTVAAERSTLAAVQNSMVEGLVVLDAQGQEVYRNRALGRLTGMSDRETLGRPLRQILEERQDYFFEDPKTFQTLMEALDQVKSGRHTNVEAVLRNPRRRIVNATVFPIPVDGQEPMAGILLRDVTQEREVDQRREAFVSVASHELRTPMTAIVGFAELLRDREPAPEVRSQWLNYVISEGYRLTAIVEDMLNVSRIQSGKLAAELAPLTLREVAFKVTDAMQQTTANHRILLHVSPDLPPVMADSDKLFQVLLNLLSNAIKYSPAGGEVTVSAHYQEGASDAVLSVRDQGMGIAPEDQERLFTTFTRIRRPETEGIRGTGLGLYIVKGLVELMHGRIWMESELNKGSTFFVSLPLAFSPIPESVQAG